MKKLNYLLLGAAGLLMASCASEDLQAPGTGDGLQITINLCADPGTRADAELPTQMTLNYAVYDSENALVEEGDIKFTGTSTTFNTNLLTGKDYTLAFFAQNSATTGENAVYTFDAATQTVSVDYDQMNNSDYNNGGVYDCFYNTYNFTSGSTTSDITVTLYRPLAQINWGTNDLKGTVEKIFQDAEGNPSLYATLETDAYSKFSLLDGSLTGEKKVILGAFTAPTDAYPVSSYTYVGMQYILASPTSELYDLNLAISNNDGSTPGETVDLVVTSAPLQANYKTNIYGSLLTDNVNLNVELGEWGGTYDNPMDESTLVKPGLYQVDDKTFVITNEEGMINWATMANEAPFKDGGYYAGYTVLLGNNLDMSTISTPYVPFTNKGATFDGQGHTIKNLTVKCTGTSGTTSYAGFMANGMGVLKDLTFVNANITSQNYAAVAVAYGIACKIENVTVLNSTITSTASGNDGGNKVGAVCAFLTGQGYSSVTDCVAEGNTIKGYRQVGGLIGAVDNTTVVTGNTVSKTTITSDWSNNYNEYTTPSQAAIGEIIGYIGEGNLTNSDNTASEVTIIYQTGAKAYLANDIDALRYLMGLGSSILTGKTITLDASATDGVWDLKGSTIAPLPGWVNGDATLTIDGNNVTIKNVNISGSNYVGLFGSFSGTIKNLNIENINVTPTAYTFHCGALIGNSAINTIENVTIKKANVDCSKYGNWVGVLVGAMDNPNPKINKVNLEECTVNSWYAAGGMAGIFNGAGTAAFTECSISNCNLTGAQSRYSGIFFGAFNSSTGKATYTDCTVTGSTVNGVTASVPN